MWTGAGAPCGACGRGKGACAGARAGACGTQADSSARGNAAPEGARVATSGPADEGGVPAAEAPGTFLAVPVGAGRAEVRSQDPERGSRTWGSGPAAHWGAPGRTGAPREESEEAACHLGGWRSELGKDTSEVFLVLSDCKGLKKEKRKKARQCKDAPGGMSCTPCGGGPGSKELISGLSDAGPSISTGML